MPPCTFVLKDLVDQFLARIDPIALGIQFFPGQEHLGLDPHQRGNKQYEFAGKLNIQRLLRMDIGQKIIDDLSDRNIINIQFIPLNEEKEEVKWTFKLGQFYLVRAHGGQY